MMKILLVEDEDRSVEQTTRSIRMILPDAQLFVAGNLHEARELIAQEGFDLAICDLRIGSRPRALDSSEVHGRAVYDILRESRPGTPVIFLSGFASWENLGDHVASGGVADVYGIDAFKLTRVIEKGDPGRIEAALTEIADGLTRLQKCIVTSEIPLDDVFERAVQTYGAVLGSQKAIVRWKSGLSGAKVALVEYEQDMGTNSVVAVKVDGHERAERELQRYDRNVGPRLQNGSFATRLSVQKAGLRGEYAIIYAVATRTSQSLFECLSGGAPGVDVSAVRDALSGWQGIVERRVTSIGSYRESLIGLDDLRRLPEFTDEITSFDDVEVELSWKLGHGDFHGENIFIDGDGRAVAIDFADCGIQPAGLDPMALELSLYVHPRSPVLNEWRLDEYEQWSDVSAFTEGKAVGGHIIALREWAADESDDLQLLVVAYGQACWLMKHGAPGAGRAARVAVSALRAIAALC